MKRIYMFLLFVIVFGLDTSAQVSINESFDASTTPTGWAYVGFSRNTSSPCTGAGVLRRNIYGSAPSGSITTPTWTSNGQSAAVSYKYKLINFSGGTALSNTNAWGKIITELSLDGGTSYNYQIDSVVNTLHVSSTACATRGSFTIPAASIPSAAICKVRFRVSIGSITTVDYYVYIDDVVITQVAVAPPNCITAPSTPGNAATAITSSILTWPTASGSPTGYIIYIGTDGGGTTDPTNIANGLAIGNVTTYTIPSAYTTLTNYYWKVVPTNANGSAVGCAIWSFTTGTAPSCVTTPTAPLDMATTTCFNLGTTLSWTSSATATSYDVYFGTTLPAMPINQTSLTYATGALLPSTTYSWKIVPKNQLGLAMGCATWSFITDALPCYCVTTPSNVNATDIITNVTMGTLNNTSTSNANNYIVYNNTPVNLTQGVNQNISITFGTDGTQYSAVWIDFNQNGNFETSENVALATTSAADGETVNYSLAISATASVGQTRMRVRGGADGAYTAAGACNVSSYGETEDYLVNIIAGTPCAGTPVALTISPVTTTICGTGGANFTSINTNTGIGFTYQWQSSPAGAGTFTDIAAATTSTYSATGVTSSTDYVCNITCTASGRSTLSNIGTINISSIPANDLICNAVALTLNGASYSGNTTCATSGSTNTGVNADPNGVQSSSAANNTVWFTVTPSLTSTYTFEMITPSTGQLNGWLDIYSYTSTCPAVTITEINSTSLNFGATAGLTNKLVTPSLNAGQTYYIRLDGVSGAFGAYEIAWKNVGCQDFIPTPKVATLVTNNSASLNWKPLITPPTSGYDYYFSSSSVAPLNSAMPTGNVSDSTVAVTSLMPVTNYYYWVRSNCGSGTYSNWSAVSSFKTLLINDLCTGAIDITSLIGINAADTVGKVTLVEAGIEGTLPRPNCTGPSATGMNKDVWYKFTASNVTDSTIIYTGTNDWIAELYSACGSTMVLACSDDENSLGPVLNLCGLNNGQVYYIRLMPYSSSTNTEMWIYKGGACPIPPVNDNCSGSVTISADCSVPTAGTLQNSSASTAANLNCGGSSTFATQSDVWFKFVNGANSLRQKILINNIPTGKIYYGAVYSGKCDNLVPKYCLAAQVADSISTQLFGLMRDSTYYVRIWETVSPTASSTFSICITDSTIAQAIDSLSNNLCNSITGLVINAANNNTNGFIPLYNPDNGQLIAEIDAQGNTLGAVTYGYYRNTGAIRLDDLSKPYLDRNIFINVATQPTSMVNVRFYFSAAERAALDAAVSLTNDRNDLKINRVDGPCSATAVGTGAVLLNQYGNGSAYNGEYLEVLTDHFSQFFITKSTITLPLVALDNFKASKQGVNAAITWNISAVNNISKFEVLKSTDGRNFNSLTSQNAINNVRTYNATDANLVNGANYYKLKITDRNGTISYSTVAVVYHNTKGFEIVSLIPTLVRGNALASIGSDKAINATLIVTDMQGKTMLKKVIGLQAGTTDVTIEASKFAVGAYMLRAISSDGASNVIRFIKQ